MKLPGRLHMLICIAGQSQSALNHLRLDKIEIDCGTSPNALLPNTLQMVIHSVHGSLELIISNLSPLQTCFVAVLSNLLLAKVNADRTRETSIPHTKEHCVYATAYRYYVLLSL